MTVCLTFNFSCIAVEWTIIRTGSTLNGMIVTSQSHTQRPAVSTKRVTTHTEISQTQICIQRYVCMFSFRLELDNCRCKVNLLFCWGRTFSCLLIGCNEGRPIISQLQCGRYHRARAPIVATWADRFSPCCWQGFSGFLVCPITPVTASHCLSSLLNAVAAA